MSGQAGAKHPQYRHGGRVGITSPEYSTWRSMRARCLNPKDRKYPRYGALGVLVCAAWEDFSAFLADMGSRPSSQHTIDRIDPLGHYEPGNCRWADPKMQNRNRTNNKRVTFQGETLTVAEWAERFGVDQTMIGKRLRKGVPVEVALTTPSRKKRRVAAGGPGMRPYSHHCTDRCAVIVAMRRSGIKYAVIGQRLGLTKQRVGQIGKEHSRRGEFPARVREAESHCITCRRELDPRVPESKILPAEDCCGWCGRRWDGGLMTDLTLLLQDLTSKANGGPCHTQ